VLTLTLLQNLCFTKKSISVAMGSPAHIDFGGSSALQLTSPLRSQTYDGSLQSTVWDMQPPQVSHLVCMGSATHKSLICHLHGLCSQHKFYLSFLPWLCSPPYKLQSVGLFPSLRHFLIFAAGCVSVVSHEGRVSVPWNWVLRLSSISFMTKRDADAKSSCGTS